MSVCARARVSVCVRVFPNQQTSDSTHDLRVVCALFVCDDYACVWSRGDVMCEGATCFCSTCKYVKEQKGRC